MDYRQFFKDLLTFNSRSFRLRRKKLSALVRRKLFLPFRKNFGQGREIKSIPVIINNRNRLTFLRQLIDWLEKAGYRNIFIIDNASTYPPLLDYYRTTRYKVFHLTENVGHLAFWKTGIFKEFYHDYYIYTDPDVVPVEECPNDVAAHLLQVLDRYPAIEKVGLGLKIDDLPDAYADMQQVIGWEKKFWDNKITDGIYDAGVDTTFALYRPYTNGAEWVQKAYRTGEPYIARHLPWYENSANPLPEDIYYRDHIRQGASHWIKKD